MRLRNIVLEAKNVTMTAGDTEIKVDSIAPSAREIVDDVYPMRGDVNTVTLQVFQKPTQLAGSSFINVTISGSANPDNIINENNTMKMTGSLSAPVQSASTYKWGVLMVANSVFEG